MDVDIEAYELDLVLGVLNICCLVGLVIGIGNSVQYQTKSSLLPQPFLEGRAFYLRIRCNCPLMCLPRISLARLYLLHLSLSLSHLFPGLWSEALAKGMEQFKHVGQVVASQVLQLGLSAGQGGGWGHTRCGRLGMMLR